VLLKDILVVAHVVCLRHDVAHELTNELLGSFIDFVHEQLAAHFHPLQGGLLERMALIAPNKSLVRGALQEFVQLALVLERKQAEGSSLFLLTHQLP
jgi:hypothetical protein